mmetsp:Transcript_4679/g.7965  ORF Transcript_4679/g.7965 Transcript_4679/m.7965 type:complete len:251 (+) Transcript_4679:71-823(+)|eukprot:CAMPEP_0198206012 /NCGR_PEP_ID=MMETSP1445-20131203/9541_1 /TAXON_ID=36898 /ORGANISM="Pyramimonas sp., Strain CCMP2087" /LENGTH=250 /DNA_ID=CAMNT_0043878531 /DNA_START=43 /DNA_END=795 /DNA_ORIENTATION=-
MDHEILPQRERRSRKRKTENTPRAECLPSPESALPAPVCSLNETSEIDREQRDTGPVGATGMEETESSSEEAREKRAEVGKAFREKEKEEQLQAEEGRGLHAGTDIPAGANYEYLDHTADIQLHSWGENVQEAFEGAALAMFNYMTPLNGVQIREDLTRTYEVQAHDMQSLLFAFLDELLFVFSTEYFVCSDLKITHFDRANWIVHCVGRGEIFHRTTHESGTEVKAITYSAMQIHEKEDRAEIFVIVDI